jgi:uncharacterized heparinase superfamily protein
MGGGARMQRTPESDLRTPVLSPDCQMAASSLPVRYTKAGFCFLSRTVRFADMASIDWNYPQHGKLWTYNLNYFEYLRQPGLETSLGVDLIDSWIAAEVTHKDGWEPYTISLRMVNWLQFYRINGIHIPLVVERSIRRQYRSLLRKIEYHLGGNHLLENALALAITSRFLKDDKGQVLADRLLREELHEQYLPDGSHYERSVMYHLILLWGQLDVYSWLRETESLMAEAEQANSGDSISAVMAQSLRKQLAWAQYIITPEGRYPHFNDSAPGIAPDWPAILAYATSLGLAVDASDDDTSFVPSTYHHWSTSRWNLWIDAGYIGPDYIPGHAHADSLTFALDLDGSPFILDVGISTYEKNERRAFERSTKAHNTVTINQDQNSSQVWGGFRVGKRARTKVVASGKDAITIEHDGFPGTTHRRAYTLDRVAESIIISDTLTGRHSSGIARLHFASDVTPEIVGAAVSVGQARLDFTESSRLELFTYERAVAWNELKTAYGLAVYFTESYRCAIKLDYSRD